MGTIPANATVRFNIMAARYSKYTRSKPRASSSASSPYLRTAGTGGQGELHTDRALVVSLFASLGLHFIPGVHWVTYPLRLLVTFIHEGFHAFATLLTGGTVHAINIETSGSGVTLSTGGFNPIIASAGYLGATLYGALILWMLRKGAHGSRLLGLTAVFVALSTVGGILHPFTLLSGLLITAALMGLATKLPRHAANWAASFVGAQFAMNALLDLNTLWVLSVSGTTPTDAQNMFKMTMIPAGFWATLWLGMSIWILWRMVIRPAVKSR